MVFVVSGPSGCGKSTLIRRVMEKLPGLRFSVSHTTRPPRPSERDGVDYHFISEAKFARMVRDGRFVEWAVVHGHRYGTSLAELKRAGKGTDLVLDVDVQGARQARERIPGAVLVFVMPPSAEELERRLLARGQDGPEAVARRLRDARAEVREYARFDFVVVNDELDRAVEELAAVIVAARCRVGTRASVLRPVLGSFSRRGGRR
jgi:guanylate kinase